MIKHPIIVKTDCNGCGDFAALLHFYEKSAVDAIEVSGVNFNMHPQQKPPFYFSQLLSARKAVSVPLILVGGIFSLSTAELLLQQGIDLVSFSRPNL